MKRRIETDMLELEDVAKAFRLPYWLIDGTGVAPSWFARPVWRLRALIWRHT